MLWPASEQHSGNALPSPHSQQPDARMKDLQTPAAQTWSAPHAVPQLPQCVGSFIGSMHAARVPRSTEQAVSPPLHALLQPAASHLLLLLRSAGQALLHAPQLSGSVP